MLKQMIEHVNDKALQLISKNADEFISYLQKLTNKDSENQEISWNETFMAFVWMVEWVPKFKHEIEKNSGLFSEKEVNSLVQFVSLKHWQFDLEALRDYMEYLSGPASDRFEE